MQDNREEYDITPERIKEADTFLSWVRSLTIQFKGKVRLVITGSIGLEPILRQGSLSHTVNTFTAFELDPWDNKTAMGCLQALANNYDISFADGTKEKIVQLLGSCIPHHVQMFFANIYMGLCLSDKGEFDKALLCLEKVLDLNVMRNSQWGISTTKTMTIVFYHSRLGTVELAYQTSQESSRCLRPALFVSPGPSGTSSW